MESFLWRPFALFWGFLVFASIAWYGSLLVIVGYKGGREIVQMARNFSKRPNHIAKDNH